MPWNKESVMSQRLRLVEQLLLPNANKTEVCESFNVSRKTAYKWLARYKAGGPEALVDMSKEPHNQPGKIDEALEQQIVDLHEENPYWGPRKLRDCLFEDPSDIPSHTTFSRVLKRNNCQVITSA